MEFGPSQAGATLALGVTWMTTRSKKGDTSTKKVRCEVMDLPLDSLQSIESAKSAIARFASKPSKNPNLDVDEQVKAGLARWLTSPAISTFLGISSLADVKFEFKPMNRTCHDEKHVLGELQSARGTVHGASFDALAVRSKTPTTIGYRLFQIPTVSS